MGSSDAAVGCPDGLTTRTAEVLHGPCSSATHCYCPSKRIAICKAKGRSTGPPFEASFTAAFYGASDTVTLTRAATLGMARALVATTHTLAARPDSPSTSTYSRSWLERPAARPPVPTPEH